MLYHMKNEKKAIVTIHEVTWKGKNVYLATNLKYEFLSISRHGLDIDINGPIIPNGNNGAD